MDKNLQIANYLMLKSISIRNISLYHGKTGILFNSSLKFEYMATRP